jgi:hypothetical protein
MYVCMHVKLLCTHTPYTHTQEEGRGREGGDKVGGGGWKKKERGRGEGGRRTKDEEGVSGEGLAKGGYSSSAADKILGNY